jgi:4-amino-4-deoxychorismate lyase
MTLSASWITQVNGEWVDSVNVRDRGLAYGDGLFETLRYQQGHIPLLSYHLDRLRLGCARLRIPLNDHLLDDALAAFVRRLKQESAPRAVVKLTVTRGCGGRGYIPPRPADTHSTLILQSQPLASSDVAINAGVTLQLCQMRVFPNPHLAGLKHLNRLEYVLAAQELPEDPAMQGLLLDPHGKLLECLHHNLFMVVDGRLKTPRLQDAGVHGVMRRLLMERLAPQLGLDVFAEDLELTDLNGADEVFICNAVRGIWPVIGCAERQWTLPGAVTERLQICVDQLFEAPATTL